jgi:hypothetical protein
VVSPAGDLSLDRCCQIRYSPLNPPQSLSSSFCVCKYFPYYPYMSGWTLRTRLIAPNSPSHSPSNSTSSSPLSTSAMVTPPISPVDHSITPAQAADQRFAALEAMVTALGVRMEQLVLPSSSADRVANPTFVPPPPISDIIPSPMITFRNPRFATVLSVESYRLRDRARALLPAQVSGLTTFANQIRPRLSDCVLLVSLHYKCYRSNPN